MSRNDEDREKFEEIDESNKLLEQKNDRLDYTHEELLRKANEMRQKILENSNRLEELGDFKICQEASLGPNNRSNSSTSRNKKFLNDLENAFISLGLRRLETEDEYVHKNDNQVLTSNERLVEQKNSLDYELSKWKPINTKKPTLNMKQEKACKNDDRKKMDENKDIVTQIKKINLQDFKIRQKIAEDKLIDETKSKDYTDLLNACREKEEQIKTQKANLRILSDSGVTALDGVNKQAIVDSQFQFSNDKNQNFAQYNFRKQNLASNILNAEVLNQRLEVEPSEVDLGDDENQKAAELYNKLVYTESKKSKKPQSTKKPSDKVFNLASSSSIVRSSKQSQKRD